MSATQELSVGPISTFAGLISFAFSDYTDRYLTAYARRHNLCDLVPTTILVYDFTITFSDEVRLYWTGRASWVSVLFFLNRYVPLLAAVPLLAESFLGSSVERCRHLALLHQSVAVFVQTVVGLLLITRTYALHQKSRPVLVFILVLGITIVTSCIWLITGDHRTGLAFSKGCILTTTERGGRHLGLAWILSLSFDTIIFSLTVARPWISSFQPSTNGRGKVPLVTIIVRDGVFYFFVLIVANVINILNFFRANSISKGLAVTLASNMSSTMMSRLMLNIREQRAMWSWGNVTYDTSTTTTTQGPYLTSGLELPLPFDSMDCEWYEGDYELR